MSKQDEWTMATIAMGWDGTAEVALPDGWERETLQDDMVVVRNADHSCAAVVTPSVDGQGVYETCVVLDIPALRQHYLRHGPQRLADAAYVAPRYEGLIGRATVGWAFACQILAEEGSDV